MEEEHEPTAKEIEEAGRKLLGEDVPQLPKAPEISGDFDDRLKGIEKRAESLKKVQSAKKATERVKESQSQDDAQGLAFGLAIAYSMIGIVLGGFLLGLLLEKQFQIKGATNMAVGISSVVAMLNVVLLLNRQNRGK
ncbi:MAG: hypothetical protein JSS72_00465 [Armatimonadetes bacterium]|nr:hypothetical protein [Armatimonadota bacterium]